MRYFETGGFSESQPTIRIDKKLFGELDVIALLSTIKKSDRDVFWGIKTGGSIDCMPVVHGGLVYFGACDHIFYAVDAETGKEIWRFKTAAPMAGDRAAIAEGIVYFGGFDCVMYAVDAKTGREIWRFKADNKLFSQVVHKGVLYFGSKTGTFYAVDAKTGREIWRFYASGSIMTPFVYKDTLYFGSWDHNLYAFTLDGKFLWKFAAGDQINWQVVADRDGVYFGSRDRHLYAVSHQGRLLWKFRTGGAIVCIPFIHEGVAYFGSYDQNLYAVSKYTGKLLWKFPTGNILYGCPIVYERRVYFGACDNNFYALGLDGRLVWKFGTNEHETMGGLGHDGKIYFGSWDCRLRCVSADTGKLIWEFKTSIGHRSDIDVDSELGQSSFELIIPETFESKQEEKYKSREAKEIGEYQTGMQYQLDIGYKARRKYGA